MQKAKDEFAGGADGWLVAYAISTGYTAVTQEVLAPYVKKKVPIPNVCQHFNVTCIDTFEMMRKLGMRYS